MTKNKVTNLYLSHVARQVNALNAHSICTCHIEVTATNTMTNIQDKFACVWYVFMQIRDSDSEKKRGKWQNKHVGAIYCTWLKIQSLDKLFCCLNTTSAYKASSKYSFVTSNTIDGILFLVQKLLESLNTTNKSEAV